MSDLIVNNKVEAQTLEWIARQQQIMQQDLWTLAEINSGSYKCRRC